MLFNECRRDINIFGINMQLLLCSAVPPPSFKNSRLRLKIDWITFKELWQTQRGSFALYHAIVTSQLWFAPIWNWFQLQKILQISVKRPINQQWFLLYQWVSSKSREGFVLLNLNPPPLSIALESNWMLKFNTKIISLYSNSSVMHSELSFSLGPR